MALSSGDRLPFCVGVGPDRSFHSSDHQAGRPAVLVIGVGSSTPVVEATSASVAARRDAIVATGADSWLLLPFAAMARLYADKTASSDTLRALLCPDQFFEACVRLGTPIPLVVVIDRGGLVAGCWQGLDADPEQIAEAALACLCALAGKAPPAPPVLFVSRLFEAEFCRTLIEAFETAPTFDSPVSSSGPDGQLVDRVDHRRKRRRDWLLEPGDGFYDDVRNRLFNRCIPAIDRAFQHEVAHLDRILVARYDEGAGHFSRHRDNVGSAVAFRQFALSVNLNAGDYEGGCLRFPEFDDGLYQPATGEGLVFSASLLHEATRVTSRCRYVLLTFLHDERAEARRRMGLNAVALPDHQCGRC
ncbi:2OG-Fe(II) oxygenase [Lichenicola sp.]|uniref:2OG-Fe(II) oxygenase n=1 Tax=Lichenicola sp. TaxID=2804529 RepID=UPI003B00602B